MCVERLPKCSAERVADGQRIAHLTIDNAKLEKANGELRRSPSAADGVAGALMVTGALIATWGAARDTGGGEVHQPDGALIGAGSGLVVVGLVALFWPERSE